MDGMHSDSQAMSTPTKTIFFPLRLPRQRFKNICAQMDPL